MELLLFALDDEVTRAAADAGVDAVVVDLERHGKDRRQRGFDTGISTHTVADVARVRALTPLPLVVRVEGPSVQLASQLAEVADAGADEALVPMVAGVVEAEACLDRAPPGLPLGVLVERTSAVADVDAIAQLPLSRLYVGLMDLMIERGSATPFAALTDGTVDRIRGSVTAPLGVGGLTRPGGGAPVPVELLAAELVRLGVDFTFLRRSFLASVGGPTEVGDAVAEMRTMLMCLRGRDAEQVVADRVELNALVARLESR